MKTRTLIVLVALSLVLGACASTAGRSEPRSKSGPSVLKPSISETPLEVRAIETRIDQETVILAQEAVIQVSKNYEMELSLSGDDVTAKDIDPSGGVKTLGRGRCTLFLRNLKVVCDQGIRVEIADFGTKPFINVSARGHCSHIIPHGQGSEHDVKRAQVILIRNENIRYVDQGIEQIAGVFSTK